MSAVELVAGLVAVLVAGILVGVAFACWWCERVGHRGYRLAPARVRLLVDGEPVVNSDTRQLEEMIDFGGPLFVTIAEHVRLEVLPRDRGR